MDPLALIPLNIEPPQEFQAERMLWTGGIVPQVLPKILLDAELQHLWWYENQWVRIEERLHSALLQEDLTVFTKLCNTLSLKEIHNAKVRTLAEQVDRQLLSTSQMVHSSKSFAFDFTKKLTQSEARAFIQIASRIDELFAAFQNKPWLGSCIITDHLKERRSTFQPILRIEAAQSDSHIKKLFAQQYMNLYLNFLFPNNSPPRFLSAGLKQLASEYAVKSLILPSSGFKLLQNYQTQDIKFYLNDKRTHAEQSHKKIAYALAVYMNHSRRRERLPIFIEQLRNSLDPLQAFESSYGLNIEDLFNERNW